MGKTKQQQRVSEQSSNHQTWDFFLRLGWSVLMLSCAKVFVHLHKAGIFEL
jgi:hypothetical protein